MHYQLPVLLYSKGSLELPPLNSTSPLCWKLTLILEIVLFASFLNLSTNTRALVIALTNLKDQEHFSLP